MFGMHRIRRETTMSEPEGFLTRWARRKQEAAQTPSALEADAAATPAGSPTPDAQPTTVPVPPAESAGEPALVDLTKLPAIESITSATDIRPFLAAGVPPELTRAALRRAWATDPAIRDFIGIAENQWDFTAPDGVPGFGVLPDGEQVRRLLARVMGEDEPASPAEATQAASPQIAEAASPAEAEDAEDSGTPEADLLQRSKEEDAASAPEQDASSPESRPRHGGALPR
jgi:Protein of unknown function (DUF3306)